MRRRVWVNDDPEANYSRCPQCDKANREDRECSYAPGQRTSAAWCPHLKEEVDGGDTQTYHVYEVTQVKQATVNIAGDPSVGIPHTHFSVELYYDSDDYAGDPNPLGPLEAWRAALEQAYWDLTGEKPRVVFDFEEEP